MTPQRYAFSIYVNGRFLALEFGASEDDALTRYAAGSTYPRDALTAKRGYRPAR